MREKARATSCLSNLKQLGLGFTQYEQDYDEITPNGTYQYGAIMGWAVQVYPYVKSVDVFKCLDDSTVNARGSSYGYNTNFGLGGYLQGGTPNTSISIAKMTSPASTVQLFEVEGNSSANLDITVYTEENYPGTVNYNGSPGGNGIPTDYSPGGAGSFNSACGSQSSTETLKYATGNMGGYTWNLTNSACHITDLVGRHTAGSNFLLADGHAKYFRGDSVSPGQNASSPTSGQNTGGSIAAGTAAGTFVATFSVI